ncbi:D-arabinono-1,4-lactone oxidase [Dokdonia sp. Hel_I_53]|uniref:D-arabinono-1,4-lactone oxidase n=1 Tax=Dokdonia sp. Hel_I_53 TaxID=1566287 RepID=UPI00119C2A3A|nr:D-arabinono-1,4-lactone oxidase [Dokdonia sp. Hel_I_53]TVZ51395.1 L-gulonolactone oxidase [Dokdonia sp. Hel_I_53]
MTKNNHNQWVSWNENIQHNYNKRFEIKTEEQFSEVIKNAENVRYYGSKQSSSDISAGTDTLINIDNYNKILETNTALKQVTVQSGMKLKELLEYVESQNWCIPCLPDINTVTIGGALATGTHGTSGNLLASYVVRCRLIIADGSIKTIEDTHEFMDALRVSLGVLGAFSTITFQCVENYTLHIKEGPERDKLWLNKLNSYLNQNDFLRILWLPHTDIGYVIKGNKIDPSQEVVEDLGPSYLKNRRKVSKILYKYSHVIPWSTYFANKILHYWFFRSKKEHKGSLYQATVTKSRGSTLELAEWTVALDVFPKVFEELKAAINSFKNKSFVHIPMDIRFINQDNSWLSYAYNNSTTVTMGCVSRNAASADSYEAFETIENIFLKYGGRPHWGKRFIAKDTELSKVYPKWNDFKELRKKMDPTNKFLNSYLSRLFGEKSPRNDS